MELVLRDLPAEHVEHPIREEVFDKMLDQPVPSVGGLEILVPCKVVRMFDQSLPDAFLDQRQRRLARVRIEQAKVFAVLDIERKQVLCAGANEDRLGATFEDAFGSQQVANEVRDRREFAEEGLQAELVKQVDESVTQIAPLQGDVPSAA